MTSCNSLEFLGKILAKISMEGRPEKNFQKIFIGSLIISRKLAILNIFPQNYISNFGNNDK